MAAPSAARTRARWTAPLLYASRWVAKNVVAAGLAKRCEVQLSYAIGVAKPLSVRVDTFGTATADEGAIARAVEQVFDLTPKGIIDALGLKAPIFKATAAHGHFGRPGFSWEETSKVDALKQAVVGALTAASRGSPTSQLRGGAGSLLGAPGCSVSVPPGVIRRLDPHVPMNRPSRTLRRAGFTLVELIAVFVIIGLLAAAVVPNVMSAIRASEETACAQNLDKVRTGFLEYQNKYKRWPKDSGVGFFAAIVSDKVWMPTVANTRRLNCPAVDLESLDPAIEEIDRAEWYAPANKELFGPGWSSYAGRDLKRARPQGPPGQREDGADGGRQRRSDG